MFYTKWRTFFVLLFTFLLVFGLFRLYYRLTDDFRLSNMTHEVPYSTSWDIPALPVDEKEKIDEILNQKFTYLGKGAQSYVFSSADGKYVLKFFKFKHLKPSVFHRLLPPFWPFLDYRTKEEARKSRKLKGVFNGYRLAYEMHKEESGLLLIHLNKTPTIHKTVTLYDKLGLEHRIDLNDVVFILQEKGETLGHLLTQLLNHGNVSAAQEKIDQIFDLYLIEYQKGIYDHDHGVMQNTGFIGERPLHLDIGKLHQDASISDPQIYQHDMNFVFKKIDFWIETHYPQYHPQIYQGMQKKYVQIFKEKYIP